MGKVVAVVRSNGERTRDACVRLVRREIDAELIDVRPFTAAVRRCFEIAIAAGADWLLTVDADVLPRPGAVEAFVSFRHTLPATTFHYESSIEDKISGLIRGAGHRMYRCDVLPRALGLIAPAIRVEASLIRRLRNLRRTSERVRDFVFGLHDHEQYYADLWRKASVHRVKFRQWEPMARRVWRESPDLDLQAAYAGWHGVPWDRPEKPPLPDDWEPAWS